MTTYPKTYPGLFLGCFLLATVQAGSSIPYPDALSSANITETSINSISSQALLIGNGEMNALVYSSGNDIRLRLAKNDCWDMRIDTAHDAALPTIDITSGKITGGHGSTDSWKRPYPTALPCAEVILENPLASKITSAKLDLAKAVATVSTGSETLDFRVLAQSNVILIHSERSLSMTGILSFFKEKNLDQWVSPAEIKAEDNFSILHQNIPGDADASGMDIYVVAGKKDSTQTIAVVTSRDTKDPLKEAKALVTKSLEDSKAIATHEAHWQEFWSKSGIKLGDTELQNWWYRMVYFYHVFSRSGGNAVGLAACFDHLAGWHNSLTLNYNIQQTYIAAGPINHVELLEPFIAVLTRNLPRAQWFASSTFTGCEGAFFHVDLWPFEPDPARCTTPCKHQQTYLPWGYTLGMDGHSAVVIWDYYKFSPTSEHLDRVYPLIKQFGLFYCSVMEKCALMDGKRKIGPSFFPELGNSNEYNVCYDIHFITAGLNIAHEAAILKKDTTFIARLEPMIAQMPTYSTQPDPNQNGQTVIAQWLGAKFNEGADRHGTQIQGIFPAGIINWFSPEDMKEMGKRTINKVEKSTTHANSNVTINIARARLGLTDEAISNAKMCFSGTSMGKYSKEQPNGLFSWNAHGNYISEQVAISRLVSELLLQSVADVIRIFPAWPKGTDASFTNLLAQGGFEVSAGQTSGIVDQVKIHSTVGGLVKIISPWKNGLIVTEQDSRESIPVATSSEGISSFSTSSGKTYLLSPR